MARGGIFLAALSLALIGASFWAAPLPIGYWSLDEAAGPATDPIGGANGTWIGSPGVLTTGLPVFSYGNASALNFDGTGADDYVELANTPALENLQENSYTISVWFRPTNLPPGDYYAGANDGAYAIVIKAGWHEGLSYDNAGNFIFDHWGATAWAGTGTWGTSYSPGSWYHVVGVWDRPLGLLRIYVDGALIRESPAADSNREFNSEPWRIGIAGPGYATHRWAANGAIDDVRLYDYALTTAQIGLLTAGVPAPQNLTATTPTLTAITLNWQAPGPEPYTYILERRPVPAAPNPPAPWTVVSSGGAATSYVDSTALPSVAYQYQVRASSIAVSGPSNIASATAGPPPPPPPPRTAKVGSEDNPCGCGSAGTPGPATLAVAAAALAFLLLGCAAAR